MESVRSGNEVAGASRATPRLSAEWIAVLHEALEKATTERNPIAASGLQHAIRRISVDAKRSDWPPEQLLVAFKTAIYALPAAQRLTLRTDRHEFVARLVSLCIKEYYGAPALADRQTELSSSSTREPDHPRPAE
jgi:hypothetical protein